MRIHNRGNNKAWERLCTLCDLRSPRFIADVSLGQRGSHPKSSVVPPGLLSRFTLPFQYLLMRLSMLTEPFAEPFTRATK